MNLFPLLLQNRVVRDFLSERVLEDVFGALSKAVRRIAANLRSFRPYRGSTCAPSAVRRGTQKAYAGRLLNTYEGNEPESVRQAR
jgi:hypothetical protein